MRYDDPQRPHSDLSATPTALQVNGSPLPSISLLRPMQSEASTGEDVWGWLACISAHKSHNRFGTYYGWVRDLGTFQAEYMEDPEATLLKYFKYSGPQWEATPHAPRARTATDVDIFSTGEGA